MRHYRWTHDFWHRMGRREFNAWVDQCARDTGQHKAEDPHSWEGTEDDTWWQEARARRERERAR